jgi:hypothetical protein
LARIESGVASHAVNESAGAVGDLARFQNAIAVLIHALQELTLEVTRTRPPTELGRHRSAGTGQDQEVPNQQRHESI